MTNGSRQPRRLLHASDLHLISVGDRACKCLESLIDAAIETGVDMVIIAGDLFDDNRVADDLVSFTAQQLKRLPVPVVILPGNHDCLVPESVYNREELWQEATNIHIFKAPQGETFVFPDLGVSVWGKTNDSYESDIRPMAGVPPPVKNEHWYVAVAHGYYYSSAAPLFLSYHITEEEISASGHDYIALGHLITFECVSREPIAFYSGSPSLTGTVAIVDLNDDRGVQVTRHYIQPKSQEAGAGSG